MSRRPVFLCVLAFSFVSLSGAAARAQSAPDLAAAEALFDAGKRSMDRGAYAEACAQLAASLRLDVGIGTMLYLAECDLRLGRTASAWGQFREAAALAASRGDAREDVARARASELEPHLSRLVVAVAGPETSGLVVQRDGQPLERAVWGLPVPVDPGEHAVEASAPGARGFIARVTVAPDGGSMTVTVPRLEEPPAPPPGVAVLGPRAEGSSLAVPKEGSGAHGLGRSRGARQVAAVAVGALGAVGLGLGAYWGFQAKARLDDSNENGHCHGSQCDGPGVQARSDAQNQANLATVAFSVGGVALAAGAVLWLTAPRAPASVALVPSLGSLAVVGAF